MASIINASSSGSGGIVQTADASGILQLQANGTVALTVNSNASLTVSNTGNGMTFASSAGSGIRVYGAAGTNQWDVYGNGANLRFSDNTGGGRIVIDGTASVGTTFGVGGATPAASGAGVTFPATQSASSDVNTLDDYEEGTWTPDLRFNNSSTGITYSVQLGTYTKIGRLVYFTVRITLTSKGSASGGAQIYGLPFAVKSGNAGGDYAGANLAYSDATSGWNVTFQVTLDSGQTYLYLRYNNGSNNATLTNTNFTNTTDCIWNGCYQTNT